MAKLTENLDQFRTFLAPLALAPLTMSLILFSGQKGWGAGTGTGFLSCTAFNTAKATGANAGTLAALNTFNATKPPPAAVPSNAAAVTAQNECIAMVDGAANSLNATISQMNTIMNSQLCSAEQKYQGMTNNKFGSLLTPISDVEAFKNMADYSSSFNNLATNLSTAVTTKFVPPSGDICMDPKTCNMPGTNKMLAQNCKVLERDFITEAKALETVTGTEAASAETGWTAVKVGLGVAAVGATVGIVKAIQHHNDANRRAKIAADYANGIIHNPDGTTTDCKTSDNYMTTACQPVLMQYCSKPENQGGAGCGTFQQSYCALSTANASYCIASTAQTYCASYSASSPACQWLATRPTSCNGNPNPQDCLTSLTNTELQSQCGSYPNDPLCQAFEQGKVVNQAGTTALQNQPVANAGTTTASGATTLDQLINTPSTTTGSTSLASTAATTTTSATTGGALNTPTVRAQMRGQPVPNMFGADSQTIASLCTSGALACPP